jgi:hypothetical protein
LPTLRGFLFNKPEKITMNRTIFYNAVRRNVFGGSLTDAQVDGMNALLSEMQSSKVNDAHHAAHILTNVHRETGGNMLGIKETVMPWHKDKNPSDATVIARLDRAYAAGKLKGVKTPYWRDGAFGRGPIQLTHWPNYEKFERLLGVPLRKHPERALEPVTGAKIAVQGMVQGKFRRDKHGAIKLSRFGFPSALDNPPGLHPRRIVNGVDGSDAEVTANHWKFHAALVAAGWGKTGATKPPTLPETPPAWTSPRVDVPAPKPPQSDPTRVNVDAPAPKPKTEPTGFWALLAKLFRRW